MDKEEFIEKALKANDAAVGQSKFSDLTDKSSTYYQGMNLPPKKPEAIEHKAARDPGEIPQLRTFQADISDAVKTDQLSSSRIALAEAKKNEGIEPDRPKMSTTSLVLILLGAMFIVGGLGAISYALISNYKADTRPPVTENPEKALVLSDSESVIYLEGATERSLKAAIQKELKNPPEHDELRQIKIVESAENEAASPVFNLLAAIESRIPEESLRSLSGKFYLGANFISGKGEPVLILVGEAYETLYPGLLHWEENMPEDLAAIFQSTASSTTKAEFSDRVIFNKDARVITDSDGSVRFFYTIEDDVLAIFAKSQQTLSEILKRLRVAKIAK